jgi:hypothetical protein
MPQRRKLACVDHEYSLLTTAIVGECRETTMGFLGASVAEGQGVSMLTS